MSRNFLLQVNSENLLQDESELSRWKQLLGRDVEILKAKANVLKIQSVSICVSPYLTIFLISVFSTALLA